MKGIMDIDEALFAFGMLVLIAIVSGIITLNLSSGQQWLDLLNQSSGFMELSYGALAVLIVMAGVILEAARK